MPEKGITVWNKGERLFAQTINQLFLEHQKVNAVFHSHNAFKLMNEIGNASNEDKIIFFY